MYTKDSFENYPALKNIIKRYGMNNFLDPLTKTIMRGHIMNYIELLIKDKTPFSMIILDIDNFKQINDNYGHHIGDLVLEETAKNIIDIVGDNGLVGRYGGDEFIIVDFKHNDYDSMHEYLTQFYDGATQGPFRKIVIVDQLHLLITGTIGTANYPNNATDYDDLFNKADKALYRGKMKGRNCFIIYVHEKHKDIDISKLMKEPIQKSINTLYAIFDTKNDFDYVKTESFNYIKKILKINFVFYFDKNCVLENHEDVVVTDFDNYLDDLNVGVFNSVGELYDNSRQIRNFISKEMLSTMLICKIVIRGEFFGYIVFADNSIERIWQNDDIALIITLARLLGGMSKYVK